MFKIIRSGFVFGTGTAFGVYLAQNYRMPDIAAVVSALVGYIYRNCANILVQDSCCPDSLCGVQTKKANNAAEDHKK